MANNSHTVMICTQALRQDTNNMWRGLLMTNGVTFYDASPVNSLPGTHSVPLAATLLTVSPWLTTPTHWLASAWELPTFAALVDSLKAGNIPTRDWLPLNLTQQRARAAGQGLYSRTQDWDPNGTLQTYEVVAQNIAAALTELGLVQIPSKPFP